MPGFGAKIVQCPQRKMRVMSAKVTGVGTAALDGTCKTNMELTDNGTGDYSLAFNLPFKRVPEVMVTPITDNIVVKLGTVDENGVQVLTENLSGAATDADFHVIILGSDAEDQI